MKRHTDRLILVAFAAALMSCASAAFAQLPGSNDGLELLFGGADLQSPEKPTAGEYQLMQAEILAPESVTDAKSALNNSPSFRLKSEGQERTCTARFARPVLKGEHLRVTLKARHVEDEQLQFGTAGGNTRCFAALKPDGTITWYDGLNYHALERLSHKTGEWQVYAIDYVTGGDRVLITAGRRQTMAPVRAIETVDTAFVETGEGSGSGDFSGLEAFLVFDPTLKALPVFGSIEWTRQEMPFISPGPVGGISGAGFVEAGGKLYQMGGFIPAGDGSGEEDHRSSRWMHCYDPETGIWSRMPDMPGRREYGKATASGSNIYFIGGAKQRPYEPYADVYHMDVSRENPEWVALPSMGTPRTHTGVGVADRLLIVAGGNEYDIEVKGYHPSTIRGLTEVLNLDAAEKGWRTAAPIPGTPRGWTAPLVANGKLWLFGGVAYIPKHADGTGATNIRLAETLVYDPGKDSWETRTPPPIAIGGWNGALYKDRYVIFCGGVGKPRDFPVNRWNSQPLVYDITGDQWLRMENSAMPPGGVYNDSGVAVIGDRIFVAGGEAITAHYNTFLIGTIREH